MTDADIHRYVARLLAGEQVTLALLPPFVVHAARSDGTFTLSANSANETVTPFVAAIS